MSLSIPGDLSGFTPDLPERIDRDTWVVPAADDPTRVRARREPAGSWVAGVCTGIAANIGWPVAVVRLTFLVLALANGLGALAYLAFWVLLPARRDVPRDRQGEFLRLVAFGLVAVGAASLAYVWGWGTFRTFVAPILVLAVGLAILWQQWDATAWGSRDGILRWSRPLVGIALVVAGVVALIVGEVGWVQGVRALTVLLLFAGGAALLALPWLVGAFREAARERKARIHEQARAELAAHVHDSVLQTLALIQTNAENPDEVARLARVEERRLRSWLYEPGADESESLAAALAHQAARVESDHAAVIEVVVVGDAPMDERMEALVAAAGEAMVNAGKHAGPRARVSVFAEVDGDQARVFVRDRGPGFDLHRVPEDRLGVRGSIIGRLERVGGRARVASGPEGTEVRLEAEVGNR